MALLIAKDLEAKINAIGKTAGELQSEIQVAAVNAIGYSIEHGDIRFGQKLFDVLPSGVRRASLVAFLEKHGNFAYLKDEKKFAHFKAQTTYDEVTLLATSWASAKKEVIVSEYDLDVLFAQFMKKLEGIYKQHDTKGVVIHNSSIYDHLHQARDNFNTEKYETEQKVKEMIKLQAA